MSLASIGAIVRAAREIIGELRVVAGGGQGMEGGVGCSYMRKVAQWKL